PPDLYWKDEEPREEIQLRPHRRGSRASHQVHAHRLPRGPRRSLGDRRAVSDFRTVRTRPMPSNSSSIPRLLLVGLVGLTAPWLGAGSAKPVAASSEKASAPKQAPAGFSFAVFGDS